jgi:hypothetical protein
MNLGELCMADFVGGAGDAAQQQSAEAPCSIRVVDPFSTLSASLHGVPEFVRKIFQSVFLFVF